MVRSQGFRQDTWEKAYLCSTQLQLGRSKPRTQISWRLTHQSGRWEGARTAAGENRRASRAPSLTPTCPVRVSLPSRVVRVATLLPCRLSTPKARILRQSWAKGESPVLSCPKRSHTASPLPHSTYLFILTHLWMRAPTQSCLTLCNPMDNSLPDSPVHRISQARILDWVVVSSSKGSSWLAPSISTWRRAA